MTQTPVATQRLLPPVTVAYVGFAVQVRIVASLCGMYSEIRASRAGLHTVVTSRQDKSRVHCSRLGRGLGTRSRSCRTSCNLEFPIFVPRTSSIVHAHFPWGRRLSRAVLCCHARTSGPPWPAVLYDTLRSGRTRDSLGKCGTSHFIHIGFFCPTSKQLPSLQPLPPPTCTPGARGAQPPSHTCHRCAARACQCSRPRARRWP